MPIELDERQHFKTLRSAGLRSYPASARLGFDRKRWIEFSDTIRAGDIGPVYGDEQRPFYDSIRDMMGPRAGPLPVVLVFEENVEWERKAQNCAEAKLLPARLETIIRDSQ